jgi:amino acid transporter/nucleotide-binding universal stress UspA family protein
MNGPGVHRPRNLDWKRAAALLYGDWGTSKAYVIGLAFLAAAYSSLDIILAVCALTAVVGYNYIVVCRHFPDGGGVYSAARQQSRVLAVMGALLLVANFTVTAAMSGWAAMSYLGVPDGYTRWATMGVIVAIGVMNYFGPKHTGNFAVTLAVPMVVVVVLIIVFAAPHLSVANLEAPQEGFKKNWLAFVGVILALSGVEAIANLTGVMKLDPGATMESPRVGQTARKSILPVAVEVVVGTTLLGWAMLSLPRSLRPELEQRWEDMMRFLAEQYGAMALGEQFGQVFGIVVGIVVGLLLLSAVNTAIGALIGLSYMLARDGEMPRTFTRLNLHGVPWIPLVIAALLPLLVAAFAANLQSLAGLYAIGVVGAITVNLGSCATNLRLPLKWYERGLMALTFLTLFVVELTIAKTKKDALFFAVCVVGAGLGLRAWSQRRAGLRTVTIPEHMAVRVSPETALDYKINLSPGQSILVAARGLTPVLGFALEEARLRQGTLYVLYVKELAVTLPGPLESVERPRWQDDLEAAKIMTSMLELGRQNNVPVVPLYSVSENPAATILDLSATLGIDILMLGARHRRTLAQLFKGDVANRVAKDLPENIQLVIHG